MLAIDEKYYRPVFGRAVNSFLPWGADENGDHMFCKSGCRPRARCGSPVCFACSAASAEQFVEVALPAWSKREHLLMVTVSEMSSEGGDPAALGARVRGHLRKLEAVIGEPVIAVGSFFAGTIEGRKHKKWVLGIRFIASLSQEASGELCEKLISLKGVNVEPFDDYEQSLRTELADMVSPVVPRRYHPNSLFKVKYMLTKTDMRQQIEWLVDQRRFDLTVNRQID